MVEANNLQVQVSTLRKLLGPGAIVTIPGRGYRFAAPVTVAASGGLAFRCSIHSSLEDDDTPARDGQLDGGRGAAAPSQGATSPAPAPAALDSLPALATTLLGREHDLAALDQLLRQHRLTTVVGAGGMGKTSLALAAAHQRQQGLHEAIVWVDLAGLADPGLLPSAVAQAAQLPASARDDALQSLVEGLRPLTLLLVLDNVEHLIESAARVAAAALAGAPGVRMLATSQVPLRVDGEFVMRLDALSVPADGTALEQALAHGAVALFAARAAAAERRFAVTDANLAQVIELCRRLDGIPLAIRLAAARIPLLGLHGVIARLTDRLQLLRGGAKDAPARQQTLHAALDWSHGLLEPSEQTVFRRLGVFAGGFTLELASAVASDQTLDEWAVIDALGALVDRSLVAIDGADTPRYRLLESARDYAKLKLDAAAESATVQQRHALALAAAFDRAYEDYWSTPDRVWLASWAPEIDNVRAALAWSMQHDAATAVRLMGAASPLFLQLGLSPEARRRGLGLEALAQQQPPGAATARYWLERGRLNWGISSTLMRDLAQRAADIYRTTGEARGLYLALRCAVGSGALQADAAWRMLDEMAGLESARWPARLRAQRHLAEIGLFKSSGRIAELRGAAEALLASASAAGLDLIASAALSELAAANLSLGNAAEALSCARRLTADRGRERDNFVVHGHAVAAQAMLAQGQTVAARRATSDFLAASRCRDWEWFGLYADLYALLAACEGRAPAAARLIGHADAASRGIGERGLNMASARAQAWALVAAELAPPEIERLAAHGAVADIETVCAWTLADPGA